MYQRSLLLIVGAGGQQQAWLFQLGVVDAGPLTAEHEDFVSKFVMSASVVAAGRALAAVVATGVNYGSVGPLCFGGLWMRGPSF